MAILTLQAVYNTIRNPAHKLELLRLLQKLALRLAIRAGESIALEIGPFPFTIDASTETVSPPPAPAPVPPPPKIPTSDASTATDGPATRTYAEAAVGTDHPDKPLKLAKASKIKGKGTASTPPRDVKSKGKSL